MDAPRAVEGRTFCIVFARRSAGCAGRELGETETPRVKKRSLPEGGGGGETRVGGRGEIEVERLPVALLLSTVASVVLRVPVQVAAQR